MKQEKYHESLESFDKALEIDPKDAEAWYSKGLILWKINRNREAAAIKSFP